MILRDGRRHCLVAQQQIRVLATWKSVKEAWRQVAPGRFGSPPQIDALATVSTLAWSTIDPWAVCRGVGAMEQLIIGTTGRDRDRLRQQVLEGLGWHIIRIWSKS
jgi:hypothetical protein